MADDSERASAEEAIKGHLEDQHSDDSDFGPPVVDLLQTMPDIAARGHSSRAIARTGANVPSTSHHRHRSALVQFLSMVGSPEMSPQSGRSRSLSGESVGSRRSPGRSSGRSSRARNLSVDVPDVMG